MEKEIDDLISELILFKEKYKLLNKKQLIDIKNLEEEIADLNSEKEHAESELDEIEDEIFHLGHLNIPRIKIQSPIDEYKVIILNKSYNKYTLQELEEKLNLSYVDAFK